ncbi:MAG: NAD(P)H nitroreductase [Mycobacteriaceae bacterium]|nr:NAD(P)H nitroreductase [Mycobacteriaceae bacterium]
MTEHALTGEIVETALDIACRAPSLHNSQPWKWVAHLGSTENHSVDLFFDGDRMLPFTDQFGRQMIISCGAALHHAQVSFAALGFPMRVERFPDPQHPSHLARLTLDSVDAADIDIDLAAAISRRSTDRLPFDDPADWNGHRAAFEVAAAAYGVAVHEIPAERRAMLAQASAQSAAERSYDDMYQAELSWWTGHSTEPEGVPRESLPSLAERSRVSLSRAFPTTERAPRRPEIRADHSRVLALTTPRDSHPQWLACGEALSAVLLTATARGLATCALTHLTEVPTARNLVAGLLGSMESPQVLIRVGAASNPQSAHTRRRPLAEVLRITTDTP